MSAPHGLPAGPIARLTDAVGGPARRRVIILLAAVLGLQAADAGAIGALAAPLERSFHVGNASLGLLVTASTLVGAVGTLPFGVLADRVRRVRLLEVAVLVWALATLVSAFSVSYTMLLVVRLALGVLVAAAGPLVVSLAGDLFPADERSRLFGFVLTGELLGAGFGIVLAGTLSSAVGWRPAIGILALPGIAVSWGLWRCMPEPARGGQSVLEVGAAFVPATAEDDSSPVAAGSGPVSPVAEQPPTMVERQAEAQHVEPPPGLDRPHPDPTGFREAAGRILEVRTNVVLILASGLGYFFLQGLETFAELFLRDRFGIGQSAASLLFIVVAVGAVTGVLASGRVADRRILRGRPDARMVVSGVCFVVAAVLFVPALGVHTLLAAVPLFVIAAAALGGVNPPLDAARLDVMPASMWGRAEAVRTSLRTVLQGVAPLVFGLLSGAFGGGGSGLSSGIDTSGSAASAHAGTGLAWAFLLASVPLVLAGIILLLGRHRYLADVVATGRARQATMRRAASRRARARVTPGRGDEPVRRERTGRRP